MTALQTELNQSLQRAAARAVLAPSVHNTQPWRIRLGADSLEIAPDWGRQLTYLDPTGRQLMISVGCALLNARASLASEGLQVQVQRSASLEPGAAARITVVGSGHDEPALGALDSVAELRQTNRRRFEPDPVDGLVVDQLLRAAAAEGADLIPLTSLDTRLAVARLTQAADRLQSDDPAYRAELRAWTTSDPIRLDGVPAAAVPHGGPSSRDDIPLRDFDTRGDAALPEQTESSINQCLLVLATAEDSPAAWLGAGEALERVWLEVFRSGLSASIFTSLVELAPAREQLRGALGTRKHPHALIRVGRAPRTPASRRRRLGEVLDAS